MTENLVIDSRGYVIEPSFKHRVCDRVCKPKKPKDKAIDNHGHPLEHLARPSRRDKTMIGDYVSYVEATSYGEGPA